MADKYTIWVLLINPFFFVVFLHNFVYIFLKRGQSYSQQQYIQDFFKKKPCQRQVDEVQCRSEPLHPAGASRPANYP